MVLYLHGFTGGAWEAEALTQICGREVVSLDLPGHDQGQTPGDCSMASACARVSVLAEQAGAPVDLIGYSMGGRVALSLAVERPCWLRKLVLIGARPGLDNPIQRAQRLEQDEARAKRIESEGVLSFADAWETLPIIASQRFISPELRKKMQATRRAHSAEGLAASLRDMGSAAMPSLWHRLKEVDSETLWITGSEDRRYGELATRALGENELFSHKVIQGAGHCAHFEKPHSFRSLLDSFW